jgi:hypothetical protein
VYDEQIAEEQEQAMHTDEELTTEHQEPQLPREATRMETQEADKEHNVVRKRQRKRRRGRKSPPTRSANTHYNSQVPATTTLQTSKNSR